jgi:hypothetical protein
MIVPHLHYNASSDCLFIFLKECEGFLQYKKVATCGCYKIKVVLA